MDASDSGGRHARAEELACDSWMSASQTDDSGCIRLGANRPIGGDGSTVTSIFDPFQTGVGVDNYTDFDTGRDASVSRGRRSEVAGWCQLVYTCARRSWKGWA